MSAIQLMGTILVILGITVWLIERYLKLGHHHLMTAIRAIRTKED